MKTLFSANLAVAKVYGFKYYTMAYGIIFLMLVGSASWQEREIVLPEIAALSIGLFVYKKSNWYDKPLNLFLIPTTTAFIGFFINKLPIDFSLKILMVMIIMFVLLHFIKSRFAPALATGLLPIVTNSESYVFIFAIMFFMGLLGLLSTLYLKPLTIEEVSKEKSKPIKEVLVFSVILFLWGIICYYAGFIKMAALPPVIVMGYELIDNKNYGTEMFLKHITALLLSAFIVIGSFSFLDNFVLAAAVNFTLITIVLHFLKIKLPPVYAVAVLPMVIPGSANIYFVLKLGLMAAVILGSIYLYINKIGVKKNI